MCVLLSAILRKLSLQTSFSGLAVPQALEQVSLSMQQKQEATLPGRGLFPTNAISSFFIDDQGLILNAFNYFSKKAAN